MASTSTDRRQGVNPGAAIKVPCRVATTANITLSGLQTVDGVVLSADDRVLVKDQTTSSENGIYKASSSSWQRDLDFDGVFDVVKGTVVHVTDGTTNSDKWYQVTTSNPLTPGSTSLTISETIANAANITFTQSGIGTLTPVARTSQDKGRELITSADFSGTPPPGLTGVGTGVLANVTTGSDFCTAFGNGALAANTSGFANTAVGYQALHVNTIGSGNTAVGTKALNTTTGGGNVGLGYFAGAYETGSNAFYVDNQDRTNTAGDTAGALLYGTFNANPANQTLRVNGKLTNAYGLKASSQELAVFSTTDGNLASAIQLIVSNSTTAAILLQSVHQGTGYTRLDLNPSGGEVTIQKSVATPAGGSADLRLAFGSTAGFGVYVGSGAPTVSAAKGSLYLRSDGSSTSTRAYINTDGSTTWTAITTAA